MGYTNTGTLIPLVAIQNWPQSNSVGPERRVWLVPYAILLAALTTLIIGARLVARVCRQAGSFGADDVLIIISWVFGLALTAAVVLGTLKFGFDRHIWDNHLDNASPAAFLVWFSGITFIISTSLTKISNLLFYLRMCPHPFDRTWVLINYAGIGFVVAYMLAFTIVFFTICRPLEATWKAYSPLYQAAHICRQEKLSGPLVGIFSVVTDVMAAVLPAFVFRSLRMPRREKVGLWAIFGLGLLTAAVGVGRVVWLFKMASPAPDYDLTWISYELFAWSISEYQLGMITASIPSLRVYVAKFLREPAVLGRLSKRLGLKPPHTESEKVAYEGIFVHALQPSTSSTPPSQSAASSPPNSLNHGLRPLPPAIIHHTNHFSSIV